MQPHPAEADAQLRNAPAASDQRRGPAAAGCADGRRGGEAAEGPRMARPPASGGLVTVSQAPERARENYLARNALTMGLLAVPAPVGDAHTTRIDSGRREVRHRWRRLSRCFAITRARSPAWFR